MTEYKNEIIFFTGAGISASAGIPTFDEQEGLRDKLTRSYCMNHPEEYKRTIEKMREACDAATPTAAHLAIAETGYPVITMNIDGLHEKAGTKRLYPIHGRLPNDEEFAGDLSKQFNIPVLYDDPAPLYDKARRLVQSLEFGRSIFVIIGTSYYSAISVELASRAKRRGAKIIEINRDADILVPRLCAEIEKKYGKRDNII